MVLEEPAPIASAPLRSVGLPLAEPAPGMIRIRVAACGVCRTDLQLCEGDLAAHRLPVVPGHQIVGRVEAWLASTCGVCDKCRSGRENLCAQATFTGWDVDGGYATHVTARADFALPIPDGFDDLSAAPLLCGGVIGYRSLARSGIQPGGGLGRVGFGAWALARHWGCRVFVATRSERERAVARELGAEWTGGYADPPPEPLDAAITFAPSGDVVRAALRAVDRGATVAINAIHLDRLPELPYEELWWERRLASVANFTRADARAFLELAARIPIKTAFEIFPLAEANVALARLERGEIRGAAVLTTTT
jgi:propanol-preferring alcohol dehydrogenase